MKYIVKTPSEHFKGIRSGVQFVRGTAELEDDKLVQVFKDLGYEVTEIKAEATEEEVKPKKPANKKKRGE